MTLNDIKTRIWERLEENSADPQRFPQTDVEEYVKDGARFYIAQTGCYRGTTTITQEPDVLLYDLPKDCVLVSRVLWRDSGNVLRPLAPTTARQMDQFWTRDGRWLSDTGVRAERYFIFGLDKIALHPSSSTGQSYVVHYSKDLGTSDDPTTIIPDEDHELLVTFALLRCLLTEGKANDASNELDVWDAGVKAAMRRRASLDRVWAVDSTPGWQGIGRF